ncbi:MAG: MgtC/SapB family protein [Bacteroidales bacterium]|nr:MgtC/SapB family protein [Bacteroidales bacterium]MBR5908299.1 MgtC/SapB family protein [Bacteroidales bacterium]
MTIEWNFILRIFIAGLLGGLIGFEREMRAKEAGLRTHFVVALGSALFMVVSQFAFGDTTYDRARVAAQVVSGIGFIGAGVIIFQKNAVRGITTAAGLWVAAAIGLTCGSEMYTLAVAATLITVICLEAMHFITRRVGEKILTISLLSEKQEDLTRLFEIFRELGIGDNIKNFSVSDSASLFELHIKQKDYLHIAENLLAKSKGLKIEIS